MKTKKRSIGITILAILLVLSGILALLSNVQNILELSSHKELNQASFETLLNGRYQTIIKYMQIDAKNLSENLEQAGFFSCWNQFVLSRAIYYALFMSMVTSLLLIVIGVGVYRLKEWGRLGTVFIHIIFIPILVLLSYTIFEAFIRSFSQIVPDITNLRNYYLVIFASEIAIMMILTAVIYFYLEQKSIKKQFKD